LKKKIAFAMDSVCDRQLFASEVVASRTGRRSSREKGGWTPVVSAQVRSLQSDLASKNRQKWANSRFSLEPKARILCSPDWVAEREGFYNRHFL